MKFPMMTRLLSGFLTGTTLAGLIALVAVNHLSEISRLTAELAEHEIPEIDLLWETRSLASGLETDLSEFLDHGGEHRDLRLQRRDEAIEESLAAYEAFHPVLAGEEGSMLRELKARYRSLQDVTFQTTGLIRRGEAEKARALFRGQWRDIHQSLMEQSNALMAYEDREMGKTAAEARAKSRSGGRMVITLAVVGTLFMVVLTFVITRSFTKPVRKLISATERVMRGDLASRTGVVRADEIGVLAERFDAMTVHLKKSVDDQRRFFADVSHELRSPLTSIRGEAEVALRGSKDRVAEYRDALESIMALARQMGRLVDELLFLARSEAGQIPYQMARMMLGSLLREVCEQNKSLALLNGVDLTLDPIPPLEVWGDREQLRRLFSILVDNGIKFTPAGGTVRVTHGIASESARVVVSDTGIGIPEEEIPRIFDRFYRAGAARLRSQGGTGLGLSIARSIVETHAGEIFVQSEVGRGTTFAVVLPRASVPMVETPHAPLVDRR